MIRPPADTLGPAAKKLEKFFFRRCRQLLAGNRHGEEACDRADWVYEGQFGRAAQFSEANSLSLHLATDWTQTLNL